MRSTRSTTAPADGLTAAERDRFDEARFRWGDPQADLLTRTTAQVEERRTRAERGALRFGSAELAACCFVTDDSAPTVDGAAPSSNVTNLVLKNVASITDLKSQLTEQHAQFQGAAAVVIMVADTCRFRHRAFSVTVKGAEKTHAAFLQSLAREVRAAFQHVHRIEIRTRGGRTLHTEGEGRFEIQADGTAAIPGAAPPPGARVIYSEPFPQTATAAPVVIDTLESVADLDEAWSELLRGYTGNAANLRQNAETLYVTTVATPEAIQKTAGIMREIHRHPATPLRVQPGDPSCETILAWAATVATHRSAPLTVVYSAGETVTFWFDPQSQRPTLLHRRLNGIPSPKTVKERSLLFGLIESASTALGDTTLLEIDAAVRWTASQQTKWKRAASLREGRKTVVVYRGEIVACSADLKGIHVVMGPPPTEVVAAAATEIVDDGDHDSARDHDHPNTPVLTKAVAGQSGRRDALVATAGATLAAWDALFAALPSEPAVETRPPRPITTAIPLPPLSGDEAFGEGPSTRGREIRASKETTADQVFAGALKQFPNGHGHLHPPQQWTVAQGFELLIKLAMHQPRTNEIHLTDRGLTVSSSFSTDGRFLGYVFLIGIERVPWIAQMFHQDFPAMHAQARHVRSAPIVLEIPDDDSSATYRGSIQSELERLLAILAEDGFHNIVIRSQSGELLAASDALPADAIPPPIRLRSGAHDVPAGSGVEDTGDDALRPLQELLSTALSTALTLEPGRSMALVEEGGHILARIERRANGVVMEYDGRDLDTPELDAITALAGHWEASSTERLAIVVYNVTGLPLSFTVEKRQRLQTDLTAKGNVYLALLDTVLPHEFGQQGTMSRWVRRLRAAGPAWGMTRLAADPELDILSLQSPLGYAGQPTGLQLTRTRKSAAPGGPFGETTSPALLLPRLRSHLLLMALGHTATLNVWGTTRFTNLSLELLAAHGLAAWLEARGEPPTRAALAEWLVTTLGQPAVTANDVPVALEFLMRQQVSEYATWLAAALSMVWREAIALAPDAEAYAAQFAPHVDQPATSSVIAFPPTAIRESLRLTVIAILLRLLPESIVTSKLVRTLLQEPFDVDANGIEVKHREIWFGDSPLTPFANALVDRVRAVTDHDVFPLPYTPWTEPEPADGLEPMVPVETRIPLPPRGMALLTQPTEHYELRGIRDGQLAEQLAQRLAAPPSAGASRRDVVHLHVRAEQLGEAVRALLTVNDPRPFLLSDLTTQTLIVRWADSAGHCTAMHILPSPSGGPQLLDVAKAVGARADTAPTPVLTVTTARDAAHTTRASQQYNGRFLAAMAQAARTSVVQCTHDGAVIAATDAPDFRPADDRLPAPPTATARVVWGEERARLAALRRWRSGRAIDGTSGLVITLDTPATTTLPEILWQLLRTPVLLSKDDLYPEGHAHLEPAARLRVGAWAKLAPQGDLWCVHEGRVVLHVVVDPTTAQVDRLELDGTTLDWTDPTLAALVQLSSYARPTARGIRHFPIRAWHFDLTDRSTFMDVMTRTLLDPPAIPRATLGVASVTGPPVHRRSEGERLHIIADGLTAAGRTWPQADRRFAARLAPFHIGVGPGHSEALTAAIGLRLTQAMSSLVPAHTTEQGKHWTDALNTLLGFGPVAAQEHLWSRPDPSACFAAIAEYYEAPETTTGRDTPPLRLLHWMTTRPALLAGVDLARLEQIWRVATRPDTAVFDPAWFGQSANNGEAKDGRKDRTASVPEAQRRVEAWSVLKNHGAVAARALTLVSLAIEGLPHVSDNLIVVLLHRAVAALKANTSLVGTTLSDPRELNEPARPFAQVLHRLRDFATTVGPSAHVVDPDVAQALIAGAGLDPATVHSPDALRAALEQPTPQAPPLLIWALWQQAGVFDTCTAAERPRLRAALQHFWRLRAAALRGTSETGVLDTAIALPTDTALRFTDIPAALAHEAMIVGIAAAAALRLSDIQLDFLGFLMSDFVQPHLVGHYTGHGTEVWLPPRCTPAQLQRWIDEITAPLLSEVGEPAPTPAAAPPPPAGPAGGTTATPTAAPTTTTNTAPATDTGRGGAGDRPPPTTAGAGAAAEPPREPEGMGGTPRGPRPAGTRAEDARAVAALVEEIIGRLQGHRPPHLSESVAHALRRLPPAEALYLFGDGMMLARREYGDLRDSLVATLRRAGEDGVFGIVRLLWAHLDLYGTGRGAAVGHYRRDLAELWIREIGILAQAGIVLSPPEFPPGMPISFEALSGDFLQAILRVGLAVLVGHRLERTAPEDLWRIRDLVDQYLRDQRIDSVEAVRDMALYPLVEWIRPQLPPAPAREAEPEPRTLLPGEWPDLDILAIPAGHETWNAPDGAAFGQAIDGLMARFRASHRARTGQLPDAALCIEQKRVLQAMSSADIARAFFTHLLRSMIDAHPEYRGDIGRLVTGTHLRHGFYTALGTSAAVTVPQTAIRAGKRSRRLSIENVVRAYWDFMTALPAYESWRGITHFAQQLDRVLLELFGVSRHRSNRATQLTDEQRRQLARDWGIGEVLPLFTPAPGQPADEVVLTKLLSTGAFAQQWGALSELDRLEVVESLCRIPINQYAGGAHGGPPPPIDLNELERRQRVLAAFYETHRQYFAERDLYHLYDVYRHVVHLRFEQDYDRALADLVAAIEAERERSRAAAAPGTTPPVSVLERVFVLAHDYFQLKRRFGPDPRAFKPGQLKNVHRIGAAFLMAPTRFLRDSDQFPLDDYVKFLLDERRIGKTRMLFAAWEKLKEEERIEGDGAVLYITRAPNMEEVAAEVELLYREGHVPTTAQLRWRGTAQKQRVLQEVEGAQIRIVHYKNLWQFDPSAQRGILARLERRLDKTKTALEQEGLPAEDRRELEKQRDTLQARADALRKRLPEIEAQWARLMKGVAVVVVDEAQEAESPGSESGQHTTDEDDLPTRSAQRQEVLQARAVRSAIASVRAMRKDAKQPPARLWCASASLFNSDYTHIQTLLGASFPDHPLFNDPRLFRQHFGEKVGGAMRLREVMRAFAERRRIAEAYQLGREIPYLVEVPYQQRGRYTLSDEQLSMIRDLFHDAEAWILAWNAKLPPERQIDASRINPLLLYHIIEMVCQMPALVGGSAQAPMLDETMRLAEEYRKQGKRVAVICQSTGVIDEFQKRFAAGHVTTRRFDGITSDQQADGKYVLDGRVLRRDEVKGRPRRQSTLDLNRFNFGDPADGTDSVLLANTQSVSSGLRIEADVLIFADHPAWWTQFYQTMGRHQNLNLPGGTQREKVEVVTMVGVCPRVFLDSLLSPEEIAMFEGGSFPELKHFYALDNRIIFELVMDGMLSELARRRLQDRGLLSPIAGTNLGYQRTRKRRRGASPEQPARLTSPMRTLFHLASGGARPLTAAEIAGLPSDAARAQARLIQSRQDLVTALDRHFRNSRVGPGRLVEVFGKHVRGREKRVDWPDLELLRAAFGAPSRLARVRDDLVAVFPAILDTVATQHGPILGGAMQRFTIRNTGLAYLIPAAVGAGQLWQAPADTLNYLTRLTEQLGALEDRESQQVLAERLFAALVGLIDRTSDDFPRFLARMGESLGTQPIETQVRCLEQLAAWSAIDRSRTHDFMRVAANSPTGQLHDALAAFGLRDVADWAPIWSALGFPTPLPPDQADRLARELPHVLARWGNLTPIGDQLRRLHAAITAADALPTGERATIGAARRRLDAQYREVIRAELDGTLAERRVGNQTWTHGTAPATPADDLAGRLHQRWEAAHTSPPLPERQVGLAEIVTTLEREYVRLFAIDHRGQSDTGSTGLTEALMRDFYGDFVATRWQQYRSAPDDAARTALFDYTRERLADVHRLQHQYRELGKYRGASLQARTDQWLAAARTLLAGEHRAIPDPTDSQTVTQTHRAIAALGEEIIELYDWIALSRSIHTVEDVVSTPVRSETAAAKRKRLTDWWRATAEAHRRLDALWQRLAVRLERRAEATHSAGSRVLDQLQQLLRIVRGIAGILESPHGHLTVRDLTVTDTNDPHLLHHWGELHERWQTRFRLDGPLDALHETVDLMAGHTQRLVVVRSEDRIIAVVPIRLEQDTNSDPYCWVGWGWFDDYDARELVYKHLHEKLKGLRYTSTRDGREHKLRLARPALFSHTESGDPIELQTIESYTGDRAVEGLAELTAPTTTHRGVVLYPTTSPGS